ncbi:SOS response-associated peptidase [Pseudoxanthomonas japonensis]|uniref:SOS response-associated peptidase n=1 Tax=Pseudoxanthomonas japonensis TaxID=69284 RepID=UPI001BCE2A01|nr:SOS response-associated peptidase [Pseudoxanthomonas japonensis]
MRRFAQAIADPDQVDAALPSVIAQAVAEAPDRYNIGKTRPASTLVMTQERVVILADMVWGLVPRWSTEPATRYTTVTARLERAPKSRIFAQAWRERHCLVPMSGYFKWDRQRKPAWPHFIQRRDGGALMAAGLWERWEGEDGAFFHSFTLLTAPNLAIPPPLTQDGPVFLKGQSALRWLSGSISSTRSLMRHADAPALESYPVSRAIASADVDDYTLLEPVEPDEKVPGAAEDEEAWDDD